MPSLLQTMVPKWPLAPKTVAVIPLKLDLPPVPRRKPAARVLMLISVLYAAEGCTNKMDDRLPPFIVENTVKKTYCNLEYLKNYIDINANHQTNLIGHFFAQM